MKTIMTTNGKAVTIIDLGPIAVKHRYGYKKTGLTPCKGDKVTDYLFFNNLNELEAYINAI